MKWRLKKDIVIKAGTIFDTSCSKMELDPSCHGECIIGLTKDTAGHVIYEIGNSDDWKDPKFKRAISRWFEPIMEGI